MQFYRLLYISGVILREKLPDNLDSVTKIVGQSTVMPDGCFFVELYYCDCSGRSSAEFRLRTGSLDWIPFIGNSGLVYTVLDWISHTVCDSIVT